MPRCPATSPSQSLALRWYYMSYHKSDREKYVLLKTMLKGATIESVTLFFKLSSSRRGLTARSSVKSSSVLSDALSARRQMPCITRCATRRTLTARTVHAMSLRTAGKADTAREQAAITSTNNRRRIGDNDCHDDSRRHHCGLAKRHRDEKEQRLRRSLQSAS